MALPVGAPTGSQVVSNKVLLLTRLAAAFLQAAALYWLVDAAEAPRSWPANEPGLFVPMLLAAIYVPVLAMLGRGKLSAWHFSAWMAGAAIIVGILGYHDAVRDPIINAQLQATDFPRFQLWVALSIGFFIAHTLVVDSAIERRVRPSYPLHFDTAWKLGVQIFFAFLFVALFWGILELGAGLFRLINIDGFSRLYQRP